MEAKNLINKIFQGEVAAVHNYGAFVKMPDMGRTQGLVHKSQISSSRVDDATEVLEKNEKVWFKVISVSDDGKIGLSMKVVDQGNGMDLDPNGVQQSLDVQQRKEKFLHGESKAITLEAVFKTTCSKCGVRGHLSKNCFQAPDSKSYDLIPEPEPEKKIFGTVEDRLRRLAGVPIPAKEEQPASSSKEEESKKKRKKRKRDDSSDSDSSSCKVKAKKKKKEKKHKKHKKSKHRKRD